MRVTTEHLDNQVSSLNGLLNRPAVPWTRKAGTVGCIARANVGNLYIEACMGSVKLAEMTNTGGATKTIIYASTKVEMHGKLEAMLVVLGMVKEVVA